MYLEENLWIIISDESVSRIDKQNLIWSEVDFFRKTQERDGPDSYHSAFQTLNIRFKLFAEKVTKSTYIKSKIWNADLMILVYQREIRYGIEPPAL